MIEPLKFATEWISAWNAHDLDRVLAHYADDIVLLSPHTLRFANSERVIGIGALRSYWSAALATVPNLKFELDDVMVGQDCLTIVYRNERGQAVTETLEFSPEGLVARSYACYGASPAAAA